MFGKNTEKKPSQELLNEAVKSVSIESFLFDLWYRYRWCIIWGIIGVIFLVIGVQGVKLYYKYEVARLQEEFSEAVESGRELQFAAENSDEPLAGFVFLNEADKAYRDKQYAQAKDFYDKATAAFQGTLFEGRAILGSAFSNIFSGEVEKGKELLEKLANNLKVAESHRAQALYQLALIALQEKDLTEAQKYTSSISELSLGGIWARKATVLDTVFPELIKAAAHIP